MDSSHWNSFTFSCSSSHEISHLLFAGATLLGPLMAQFIKQLTSHLFLNNREKLVLTAAGFFGTSAMVIQSLMIKFRGYKFPFPQTSHLTRFHKEARGDLTCVWGTRGGEVPTWSGLFQEEMKYGTEIKWEGRTLIGDQGLEKVRRNLCPGHGLQTCFCLFPFNDHGSIHKTTPGRWDFSWGHCWNVPSWSVWNCS